jgi:hypothetical protein
MKFCQYPLLLALVSPAALATPGSAALQLSGSGPYYRLQLPAGLYALALDAELSDLRVRTAQGAPLPWAWADDPIAMPPAVKRLSAPLFPLANQTNQTVDAALQLSVRPDGTLAWRHPPGVAPQAKEWVIDTHAASGNLLSLVLTLSPAAQGLFSFKLTHSDDLRQWRTALPQVTVAQLSHHEQTLQQNEVDLGGLRARYLRLSWLGAGPAPNLQSAEVQAYDQALPSPSPLQWLPTKLNACEPRFCTWNLPAHLPVDAVRIALAEPNTVATVNLMGENDVALTPSRKHRHQRLFVRHRDSRPVTDSADSGTSTVLSHSLLNTTLYRLTFTNQPERDNPEHSLDGNAYNRLRLVARNSIQEWGSQPPQLSVGTRSREIIVLARNAADAHLSWGEPQATGSAVPLAQLMPLEQTEATGQGSVTLPTLLPQPKKTDLPDKVANTPELSLWLWAALGGGLLLLAGMALSLFKAIKPKA